MLRADAAVADEDTRYKAKSVRTYLTVLRRNERQDRSSVAGTLTRIVESADSCVVWSRCGKCRGYLSQVAKPVSYATMAVGSRMEEAYLSCSGRAGHASRAAITTKRCFFRGVCSGFVRRVECGSGRQDDVQRQQASNNQGSAGPLFVSVRLRSGVGRSCDRPVNAIMA